MSRSRTSSASAQWLVAGALTVTMLGTTLPTPLYALYQEHWGFSTLTGTVIFSAYAGGVIAALLTLGPTSDVIGRKPMLMLGLASAAASDLVFLGAHDVNLLIVGRLLSGVSAGIFTGTATAAMVDLAPQTTRQRATLVATVANMGGLGLGPLVAGLLAAVAPQPLRLPYDSHLALVGLAALGLWLVPETVAPLGRLRPQLPRLGVPREVSGTFVRVALPGFVGFGVLGLFAAIAPTFLRQLLQVSDPASAGAVASVVFLGSCLGQIMLVDLLGRAALASGRAALVGGLGMLALAMATESLPLLITAAAVAGVGQGITFRAGLTQLNEQAPEDRRAEVASAFFTVMYAGISVPVLGVGLGADAWGPRPAGVAFCLTMAALCLTPCCSIEAPSKTVTVRRSDLPMVRTSGRVMPAWTARWNRRVNNRLFSRIAPFVPPYALVIHRGRRSGAEHRTPVLGFRWGDSILVALPYGEGSDWVRNLLAAGDGVVLQSGKRFHVTQIGVFDRRSAAVSGLPRFLRLAARTPLVLLARISSTRNQEFPTSPG